MSDLTTMIESARENDEEYMKFVEAVYPFIIHVVKIRHKMIIGVFDCVEDCAHEFIAKRMARIVRSYKEGDLEAYISQSIANFIKTASSRKRIKSVPVEEVFGSYELDPSVDVDKLIVVEALDMLEEEEREAIKAYFGLYPYEQLKDRRERIAALGISKSWYYVLINSGMAKLRDAFVA